MPTGRSTFTVTLPGTEKSGAGPEARESTFAWMNDVPADPVVHDAAVGVLAHSCAMASARASAAFCTRRFCTE
jgi:hypothetical protein